MPFIADFGLAIKSNSGHEEALNHHWLPPEGFTHHCFLKDADTWSYGVVLWELFTLCQYPISEAYRLCYAFYKANQNFQQLTHEKFLHPPAPVQKGADVLFEFLVTAQQRLPSMCTLIESNPRVKLPRITGDNSYPFAASAPNSAPAANAKQAKPGGPVAVGAPLSPPSASRPPRAIEVSAGLPPRISGPSLAGLPSHLPSPAQVQSTETDPSEQNHMGQAGTQGEATLTGMGTGTGTGATDEPQLVRVVYERIYTNICLKAWVHAIPKNSQFDSRPMSPKIIADRIPVEDIIKELDQLQSLLQAKHA